MSQEWRQAFAIDTLNLHTLVSDKESFFLKFGYVHCRKKGYQSKVKNISANGVDPDDTVYYELSHLDLYCLQRFLV